MHMSRQAAGCPISPAAAPGDTFRVLFVCTGNICRSAYAEIVAGLLVRERLGPGAAAGLQFASAGVAAVVGAGIHPYTRAALAGWHPDDTEVDAFRARQLSRPMAENADLVLGATTQHRAAVVQLAPRALSRTFTLREYGRLVRGADRTGLPQDPAGRARALVGRSRAMRGIIRPATPDEDQIPDPIGRSAGAHHEAAALIGEAVATIVGVLAAR